MSDDRPYKDWLLADMHREQEEQIAVAKMAKLALTDIQDELRARYGSFAASDFMTEAGTKKYCPTNAPFNVKAEAKKEVTWDSDRLLTLALSMPREQAANVFDFDVSIKERTYAKLTGATRAAAEAARTVEIKPAKFTIEKKG